MVHDTLPSGPQIIQPPPPPPTDPFIVPPANATGRHTHTIIVLHGRGDTGRGFGPSFIGARTSSLHHDNSDGTTRSNSGGSKNLVDHLGTTRFVFPTAPLSTPRFGKTPRLNQWFDNFSLADPSLRQEEQRAGLSATSADLAHLVRREARLVGGLDRVVVGGLSQGCAAALVFFLGFHHHGDEGEEEEEEEEEEALQEDALGGFFGMSGWLPFAGELDPRKWREGEGEGAPENDTTAEEVEPDCVMPKRQTKAADKAREITRLPPLPSLGPAESPAFARTPIFIGHGRHDDLVSMRLGEQARDVLLTLGCDVRWEDYDEGHWWREPEQMDHLVEFLRDVVGVETT
ncbi:Alpha/Beta hydrolase protein [Phyllosticta capitalensis]|uniref:Alpha/Beta hydrolase protein n=2 Tax=Phyllosticta capitalensis TaxID=121624 RepID=A0ABR1YTA3_9PEZI